MTAAALAYASLVMSVIASFLAVRAEIRTSRLDSALGRLALVDNPFLGGLQDPGVVRGQTLPHIGEVQDGLVDAFVESLSEFVSWQVLAFQGCEASQEGSMAQPVASLNDLRDRVKALLFSVVVFPADRAVDAEDWRLPERSVGQMREMFRFYHGHYVDAVSPDLDAAARKAGETRLLLQFDRVIAGVLEDGRRVALLELGKQVARKEWEWDRHSRRSHDAAGELWETLDDDGRDADGEISHDLLDVQEESARYGGMSHAAGKIRVYIAERVGASQGGGES